MTHCGVWRRPSEETIGLYPGLVVHDGRVTGSITLGPTRMPIWAVPLTADLSDWRDADGTLPYDVDERGVGAFLNDLLQMRGEFARLLLVLADAERAERRRGGGWNGPAWWETRRHRRRIAAQLRRCLACLEAAETRRGDPAESPLDSNAASSLRTVPARPAENGSSTTTPTREATDA